jgi:hypothetical protein
MMRSPLYHAAGRGGQFDAADAELQTDVMRFLAILSLCLVAIFALVQTIPVAQKSVEEPRTIELPRAASMLAKPATAAKPPLQTRAPEAPSPMVERTAVPKVVSKPAEKTIESVAVPVPDSTTEAPEPIEQIPAEPESAVATPAQPQQDGFTLQFEDDDALTRLISRDEVGFFAISADKSMRLKIEGGRMDFWPSSTPGKYHEMDRSTVPAEVKTALLRSGAEFTGDQLWGVTLPPRTAAQLKQFLADSSGGKLVIGGTGDLRMEQ